MNNKNSNRLKSIIEIIDNEKRPETAFDKVYDILQEVFCNAGPDDKFYDGERDFIPSETEEAAQDFLYEWIFFSDNNIDFEDWSDICKEGLELLKEFIESDLEDYKKLQNYQSVTEKRQTRVRSLIDSGKYGKDVIEWFNPD
jgi:hypothetical protein